MQSNISAFHIDKEKVYMISFKTKKPSIFQKITALIWHFELHCMAVYRLGQWAQKIYRKNKLLGLIPFLLYLFFDWQMRLVHHVVLHRNAQIGPGFHLGHSSNIIIGPAVIGENCSVSNNVIIGIGLGYQENEVPEIGNNVWIGPGVVLTGKIKIGDGTAISANSVVSKDIPEKSLVAGNPGRVIMNDYDVYPLMAYKMD